MWYTVLVLALVATADPLRIGVGVVLSSRSRPLGPLVAFWLGGIAVSIVMAAGVLFGLRDVALTAMHRVTLVTATAAAGRIQIAIGVLAVLIAVFAVGISARRHAHFHLPDAHASVLPTHTPSTISRLSMRAQDALQTKPLGMTFALGVGMLVDFRFLAALTAILASGVTTGAQLGAAGVYTLVALSFVELPLLSRLAAPAKADQMMAAVDRWARARRRQIFAVVVGLLGTFLLTRGLGHI